MIPVLDIRHDVRAFGARLGLLEKERMVAAVRALNRTMTTVRANAARSMAAEYAGLKIGTLKKRMRFTRATRAMPRAALTFSNKRFRLYGNFAMRRAGLWGVRFGKLPWRVETGGGEAADAAMLQRAFLQRTRAGTPNVWARLGRARMPFEVLVAPSLAEAFVERKIGEALARFARTCFAVVFLQEAKFRLSKRS